MGRGRVARVADGQCVEQDRRVAHRARQRPGGVLAMRDRQDAGAADQPDRRLDGDDAVLRRRRQQGARGFGADRRRGEPRRHRHRRARARPAGRDQWHALVVEIGRVGVPDLAAQRAVAGRHVDREDVGEFGQIGLAEDDRAGGAQPRRDRGVAFGAGLGQGQRAGGGVLLVAGRDVVLQEDRDAGERLAGVGLDPIERSRDRQRLGVDLAHRVELRPGTVIGLDPRQIGADERGRGGAALAQRLLQFGERGVLDAQIAVGTPLRRHRRRPRCRPCSH